MINKLVKINIILKRNQPIVNNENSLPNSQFVFCNNFSSSILQTSVIKYIEWLKKTYSLKREISLYWCLPG